MENISKFFALWNFPSAKNNMQKIGPSEVRATSGQHLGGHYFR